MRDRKVILVVSFGTSYAQTREKTIGAIERQIAQAFPDWNVQRAFTSGMVIRSILKKEGLQIEDVPAALERLAGEGTAELVIQPTHLMAGKEYEKMLAQIGPYRERFGKLGVGKPLLYDAEDRRETAALLEQIFEKELADPACAVVLMGHGTDAASDDVYALLQQELSERDCSRILIGTVEGSITLEDVLGRLRQSGCRKAVLAPLMVVAGDHACNDMAGDSPDSWKNLLEKEGFEVLPVLSGLGEYPQIREYYVRHAAEAAGGGENA